MNNSGRKWPWCLTLKVKTRDSIKILWSPKTHHLLSVSLFISENVYQLLACTMADMRPQNNGLSRLINQSFYHLDSLMFDQLKWRAVEMSCSHKDRVASGVLIMTRLQFNRSSIRRHLFGGTDSRYVGAECRQVHHLATHPTTTIHGVPEMTRKASSLIFLQRLAFERKTLEEY